MALQFNAQASAALKEIILKNNGQLPPAVEQKLQGLDVQQTGQTNIVVALNLQDIEKLLSEAMPDRKEWVKDACSVGSGYHADGKNAQFLTQILSAKIEKVTEIRAGNPAVNTRRYDPMFAEFTMDPQAQNMLLFNARNVDRSGNPLLMKIVMRMPPKLEAVVAAGEKELNSVIQQAMVAVHKASSNFTETDLRAAWGLPNDGGADNSNVNWIRQNLPRNSPETVAMNTRVTELSKEIGDAKQRFIDEQVPKLDLSKYRREPADAKPDVALVGSKASFVRTQDFNENEFAFGDPLKQISLSGGGKEISSSVFVRPDNEQFNRAWNDPNAQTGRNAAYDQHQVGDNLDRTPVQTFDDRIRVSVKLKDGAAATPGQWLDDANALGNFDVGLHIDRGLIFEPGSNATVQILGTTATSSIPTDDAALTGNQPQSLAVDTNSYKAQSMRQFLTSQVNRASWAQAQKTDQQPQRFTVASLVYGNAPAIHVGARTLNPLGDTVMKQDELAANKMSLDVVPRQDEDKDAVTVRLTLGEGFLAGEKDKASMKGWTVQVGYFDADNKWVEEKTRTIDDALCSKKESFSFDVDNFQKLQKPEDGSGNGTKRLEVRLYNADGVPAERIQIPFREAVWGD